LNVVVIASHEADLRQRAALDRALRLQPARIVRAPLAERWRTARSTAQDTSVEWVVFIDDDALPLPDAFGALNRTLANKPAIVGGRALVGGEQRFGAMFGPPRWGPDPVELSPIGAPQSLAAVGDAMRGPMDVAPRGLLIVAASFVRALADDVDPWALHLDLGLRARRTGGATVCEPRMTFAAAADPPEVVRRIPRLLRDAGATWPAGALHRDPPGPRERLIGREVRTAGNIRGYERRPYPPVSLLIVGSAAPKTANALRQACGAGTVATCGPGDGAHLLRALAATGDRYLLVVRADARLERDAFVELVERLEQSGRHALAVAAGAAPYGAALFHLGRVAGTESYTATTVDAVLDEAVRRLPELRLFAAGPVGAIVPAPLPPLAVPRTIAFVMLACGRPNATRQTFDALSQSIGTHRAVAVIAAGAATTRRVLSAWPETAIVEDAVDPNLGNGLNRVLASIDSDLVMLVRDDVQIPASSVRALQDAFARIAGLGVAVPRVNAQDLAEAVTGVTYRDLADMQGFVERRAAQYGREAQLVAVSAVPVMMLSRRALDRVGGFDPAFAFTRFGVADFTRRLFLANVPIARCDDAYAHLFDSDASGSLLAASDVAPALAAAFERKWRDRTAFDPARDRIVLRAEEPPRAAPAVERAVTVLIPIADDAEWETVRATVAALAASFTVDDPPEIAIGLDGAFDVQRAARAVHEALAAAPVPMERTLNVRIEPVSDLAAWRDAAVAPVRLHATTRDALAELRAVDGVLAVRALFASDASA
jgi:hypothetical protein